MWFKVTSAGVMAAGLLAGASALLAGPAAAQTEVSYPYCLRTAGDASECTFTSFAQCEATKSGEGAFCEPNPAFQPQPAREERDRRREDTRQ
jgi:hypothetical protein